MHMGSNPAVAYVPFLFGLWAFRFSFAYEAFVEAPIMRRVERWSWGQMGWRARESGGRPMAALV